MCVLIENTLLMLKLLLIIYNKFYISSPAILSYFWPFSISAPQQNFPWTWSMYNILLLLVYSLVQLYQHFAASIQLLSCVVVYSVPCLTYYEQFFDFHHCQIQFVVTSTHKYYVLFFTVSSSYIHVEVVVRWVKSPTTAVSDIHVWALVHFLQSGCL